MRKAMMDKIVCDYCGTIYDAEKAQCPLCGNKSREAGVRKSAQSERKAAPVKKELKKKGRTSREIPRNLLIASIVFLSLAVLVVVYFVGDMLGFWPGLEDVLNATMRVEELERPDESSCTYLDILPGAVSILGLMNDREKRVRLLIDEDVLKGEYIGCHPCVNTSSLKIRTADLVNVFLPAVGHEPTLVHLTGE